MRVLVDAGAEVNDTGGGPPLLFSWYRDDFRSAHFLLSRGADINARCVVRVVLERSSA